MTEINGDNLQNSEAAIEQMSYEQAFEKLEEIVNSLEEEQNTLEKSIELFEKGQKLAAYCARLLDQAELRIQEIVEGRLEDFTPDSGN